MIVNYELMPDDDLEQGGGLLGRKDNDTLVCYDGYDLCHGKILAGWKDRHVSQSPLGFDLLAE